MKNTLFLFAFLTSLFLSSCKDNDVDPQETEGKLTLTLDAVVGSQDFALNKDFTVNNQTLNFTQLRYWVSNVVLIKSSGEEYAVPSSYYLMEENNAAETNSDFIYPANKRESVTLSEIPAGDYKSIRFSIGVDETYNNNLSLQSGELSQLNGMTNVSWMWATSYIFSSLKAKLKTTESETTIKVETGLNANYKTLTLALPSVLHIGSKAAQTLTVNVDVTKIIDGVDLTTTPTVGASQPTEMSRVAENYATKVFTVKTAN